MNQDLDVYTYSNSGMVHFVGELGDFFKPSPVQENLLLFTGPVLVHEDHWDQVAGLMLITGWSWETAVLRSGEWSKIPRRINKIHTRCLLIGVNPKDMEDQGNYLKLKYTSKLAAY